jgi:stage II sporulation SpoE-like protein
MLEPQPDPFEWYVVQSQIASSSPRALAFQIGPFATEQECCSLLTSLRDLPPFEHERLEVRRKCGRRQKRVSIELPVELVRYGADEKPQLVRTLDVSFSGGRLAGVSQELELGEVLELRCNGSKAAFRVAWIGSPGTPTANQAGVECLAPEANVWGLDLYQPTDEEPLLRELTAARAVQKKLLPQERPALSTLDYAGNCIQARTVGGDYYDFLDLGPGEVGFVLADVAGKGIAAALLMANLQGALHSEYRGAERDLPRMLAAVNSNLYRHTDRARYATAFLGRYSDATRTLQYVNCGHNPPLLLRRNGAVERLQATAMVLGLFPEWQCAVVETQLAPGDILSLYTDGITEATAVNGEEFGEARFLAILEANRHLEAAALLLKVEQASEEFRNGDLTDDVTLVIARSR